MTSSICWIFLKYKRKRNTNINQTHNFTFVAVFESDSPYYSRIYIEYLLLEQILELKFLIKLRQLPRNELIFIIIKLFLMNEWMNTNKKMHAVLNPRSHFIYPAWMCIDWTRAWKLRTGGILYIHATIHTTRIRWSRAACSIKIILNETQLF